MPRKQYLYSDVPIPRSTLYYRRKQAQHYAQSAAQLPGTSDCESSGGNRVSDVNLGEGAAKDDRVPDIASLGERILFAESAVPSRGKEATCRDILEDIQSSSGSEDLEVEGDTDLSDEDEVAFQNNCEREEGDEAEQRIQDEGNLLDQGSIPVPDQSNVNTGNLNPRSAALDTPLNPCTPTTEGDALVMCLALGLRHSLSWVAIVDMLHMVNKLFDRQAVKDSKYYVLKYTDIGKENTVFHLYCPNCERYLGRKGGGINDKQAVECACGWDVMDINQASTFFLSLSLEEQIKDLLKDPMFVEGLDYRFNRQKRNESAYEDIYDGELYQKFSLPGRPLYERFNMSYTFNTDGCPIGKASRQTCWPIYVQINELPPRLRSKYMLLAGIYVGHKDPNMKIFLHPFVGEANLLSTQGINWTYNGTEINSKVIPLCACLDSVARCKFLNMTQFNGWYGCTLCHERAEPTQSGLRYTLPITVFEERTHDGILACAAKAHDNRRNPNKKKRVVKGVKGPAPTHNLLYLDLVAGVRPDPMHSIFLGNSRQHTDIMIKSFGKPYYIGSEHKLNAITSRLLSIRPPSCITRTPRSLKEVSLWKASEWRSWLLFYGTVCLYGIIPDEFVIHFSMLSSAVYLLLQNSVTSEDLTKAYRLILRYVFEFQQNFGKSVMVYNVHLLLHVKKSVEYLGPLWTHSAFGFEGENRYLLQLKKSPSSVAQEIARKYLTFRALPTLCEKYASSDSAVEFCEQLSGRTLKSFVRSGNLVLVGNGRVVIPNPEEAACLALSDFVSIREIRSFDRMIHQGVRYTTAAYSLGHKADDSYVWLKDKSKGKINRIFKITEGSGHSVVKILLQTLQVKQESIFHDEYGSMCPIRQLVGEGELVLILPDDIAGQCITMFLDNGSFICDVPHSCSGD